MASFLVRKKALHLLNLYGFEGSRMLKLAPRLVELENLNATLEFWTRVLKPDTIDRRPEILFIRPSVHTETFNNLTKLFANKDIPILLNNSPQILLQDWEDLEQKIQFALFTIEALHKEIVHSQYLDYPLEHIRTRYNFLFRCGMYVKPHKKDRNRHYVIPLKQMVETPLADVLKMTGLLASEYNAMQQLTIKELQYERKNSHPLAKSNARRRTSKTDDRNKRNSHNEHDDDGHDDDGHDDDELNDDDDQTQFVYNQKQLYDEETKTHSRRKN